MGMKSKSGHFGSGAGGPSIRNGGLSFKLNIQLFAAKMPKNKDQLNHIMANRPGHLMNSPKNIKHLLDLTDDEKNYVGELHGNKVYSKTIDGIQYWAYVRNGVVQDGGANLPGNHRDFTKRHLKKRGNKNEK